jgi:hypothetical protein
VVRLNVNASSIYGKKIISSLKADEPEFNRHCSCSGEYCYVDVIERPGRRFEVFVTRPRPVTHFYGWVAMTELSATYRRAFEKRATLGRIREAISALVGAPMEETSRSPVIPSFPVENSNILLADTKTLQKALRLVFGCSRCSSHAGIPFDSILESVTGSDPTKAQYIVIQGTARCPRCQRFMNENTLVDYNPQRDHDCAPE